MSVVEKMKSYIGAYGENDVRSLLHADHEEFKSLLKQLNSDESKERRIRAFERLKPLLTAHARAEEQAVYIPMINLRDSPDSRAEGNEGFVEHSLVDVLMERLGKTSMAGSEAWKAHAQVLQEMLEHHIGEEERQIFEELGEHFTDEQREAMGTDFTSRKQALLDAQGKVRRAA